MIPSALDAAHTYRPEDGVLTVIKNKTGVDGSTTADYTYDSAHPHAVAAAFGYTMGFDASGNLLTRAKGGETWSFQYAGFDKPRWMAKNSIGSEFLYNANRSRTIQLEFDQMSSGAPSHYVRKRVYGLGPTLEINYDNTAASGAPTWSMKKVRIYVPGPDGVIGAREFDPDTNGGGTETALVYHYDHLGSIESLTPFGSTAATFANDRGGKPGRFSEDAWGQRRNPLTWSGLPTTTDDGGADSLTPRGFTGHEMLDDLGLVHMNGRIYDPLLGRMLSADGVVQNPASLQDYNRYSYVRNNPLKYTDPSGFNAALAVPILEVLIPALEEAGILTAAGGTATAQGMAAARDPNFTSDPYAQMGMELAKWSQQQRQQSNLNQQQAASDQATNKADQQSNAPKPAAAKNAPKENTSGGSMDPKNSPNQKDPKSRAERVRLRMLMSELNRP